MSRLALPLAVAAAASLLPGSAAAQKIFLAPSTSTSAVSCGGGTRADLALATANQASSKIQTAGLQTQVQAASVGTATTAAVDAANSWGANAFVSIASNSGGGHGAETYHCTGCTNGTNLATAIQSAEASYDPGARGVKVNDTWDVLKRTTMGAAVTFVVFDDCATAHAKTANQTECAFLSGAAGQATIGTAIASGTCTFLGTTCPASCTAGQACSTGKPGPCAAGTTACSGGVQSCVQNVQSTTETCNGVDDDCDGTKDDPPSGGWGSCTTGRPGPCAAGTKTCSGGVPGCAQNVQATTETCNGADDDCNGTADDPPAGGWGACTTGKPGPCAAGTRTCSGGNPGCTQNVQAGTEVCNGVDDNCDGTVDEGCSCQDGAQQDCGSGVGACRKGRQTCASGAWGACVGEVAPTAETCNGQDDDCNGPVDDGVPDQGPCELTGQIGVCRDGVMRCSAGTFSCAQRVPMGDEVCDGLDNDCDGTTDEGVPCDLVPDAGEEELAGLDARPKRADTGSGSTPSPSGGVCGCAVSAQGLALWALPALLAWALRRRPA